MKLVRLNESCDLVLDIGETAEDRKKLLAESKKTGKKTLRIRIEAIHEMVTKNNIRYPADRLKGDPDFIKEGRKMPTGASSWTRPYPKPMLVNHDTYTKPLGRVVDAQFLERTTDGRPGIEVAVELSDQEAIDMVQDGRYYTVSIGADTDSLHCNICGENIIESDECTHWKGETYDGKKCHWSVGNLWFLELSFVNVPADDMARVIDPGRLEKRSTSEGLDENDVYIINEEKRIIIPLSELESESGEEEDILTVENKENAEIEDVEVEEEIESTEETDNASSEEAENAEAKEGSDEDQEDTNVSEESNEDSPPESIEDDSEKEQDVLESLLKIVKEAGLIDELSLDGAETSAEVAELQSKIADLESQNELLRVENQELTNKAIELQGKIRDDLIEKIVNLRIDLGKIAEESREEEINSYASRSEESLKDSYADLIKEKSSCKRATSRRAQVVENPGLADNSEDGVIKTGESDDKKDLTPSLVIKKLLVGNKDK